MNGAFSPYFTIPRHRSKLSFQRFCFDLILFFLLTILFSGESHLWALDGVDEDVRIRLNYNATVGTVLKSLEEQAGIKTHFSGDPKKKIKINLQDVTVKEALEKIAKAGGETWWRSKDGTFVVGNQVERQKAEKKGDMYSSASAKTKKKSQSSAPKKGEKKPASQTAKFEKQSTALEVEPEKLVTLTFKDAKIEQIALVLGQQADTRISLEGKTSGNRCDSDCEGCVGHAGAGYDYPIERMGLVEEKRR